MHVALKIPCALIILSTQAMAADLTIVGTGDGIDVLRAVGAAYSATNPKTKVIVPPSIHSSGGIAAVGSEKAVLGRIARGLSDTEKEAGIIAVPVFRLPAAIYAHPSVRVSALTARQLTDIYSGAITNWKEVGGPDLRVKVVRREEVDSTYNVLRNTMPGWKDLVITDRSKTATTTQDGVETVQSVPGAVGFGPYMSTLEQGLIVFRIDGKHPRDRDYPSAVLLSLIYKESTVTPEARSFIAYMKSDRAKALLLSLGAVPIEK